MIRTLGKARTLLGLGFGRQVLVSEAALTMLLARAALAVVPFGRLSRRFGIFVSPADARVAARGQAASPREILAAHRVGWAVRTVAPNLPFDAACLPQAMAAHAMLRRRGVRSVMHFGMEHRDRPLAQGHAWLDAAGVAVTGFPVGPDLVELGCFL